MGRRRGRGRHGRHTVAALVGSAVALAGCGTEAVGGDLLAFPALESTTTSEPIILAPAHPVPMGPPPDATATSHPASSVAGDPSGGPDADVPPGCFVRVHTTVDDRPPDREVVIVATGNVVARSSGGGPWTPAGWEEACSP